MGLRKCPRSIQQCPVGAGIQLKSSCFHRQCSFCHTPPPLHESSPSQVNAEWDKVGVGGVEHVTTGSTLFQIFCLSTILKTSLQSPYKRTKTLPPTYLPHHLPLLQYILCSLWPSFKAFLATEYTFHIAVPLAIFFALPQNKTMFCHFLRPFAEWARQTHPKQ